MDACLAIHEHAAHAEARHARHVLRFVVEEEHVFVRHAGFSLQVGKVLEVFLRGDVVASVLRRDDLHVAEAFHHVQLSHEAPRHVRRGRSGRHRHRHVVFVQRLQHAERRFEHTRRMVCFVHLAVARPERVVQVEHHQLGTRRTRFQAQPRPLVRRSVPQACLVADARHRLDASELRRCVRSPRKRRAAAHAETCTRSSTNGTSHGSHERRGTSDRSR
mmetsp:Transcript_8360/g.52130  ORF Transcript_8360/g.52130 Transcript_8360/m.52130 type:complete len:218 (+) Transcript_8360:4804-5457(+)